MEHFVFQITFSVAKL